MKKLEYNGGTRTGRFVHTELEAPEASNYLLQAVAALESLPNVHREREVIAADYSEIELQTLAQLAAKELKLNEADCLSVLQFCQNIKITVTY